MISLCKKFGGILSLGFALLMSSIPVSFAQDWNMVLPKDPKVIKGKLPNGFTYYIRPNGKPEKKVELRLAVNAGSILEDDDQLGLAHFMEHMNFNGTKNFKKNELVDYLQSIGVQFGADLNAYTSFDETVYILPIPTDKPGNLDKAFQILEDWAHNALLEDSEIDSERGVVLEESRMGKGANDRMMKKYLPEIFVGSRYADRLPIGKDEILKNFKYDVIRRFYKDWYRPDLQAVAIAGDIDSATAMKYIMKHFAGLKNPAKPRERKNFDVPARTQPSAMVLTDREATQYVMQIFFPTQKVEPDITLGDYRNTICERLVTMMLNNRLSDLARSSEPPFLYAATGNYSWARFHEAFTGIAVMGKDDIEKSLMALTAELVNARDNGFTATELELARRNMMSVIEKAYNERNTTESSAYVDEYVRNFLTGECIPGIENEYTYYQQILPQVKVDELNAIAKKWLTNSNVFALLTGPDDASAKLPSDAEFLQMVQKGFSQKVAKTEEKEISSELLKVKPTPGKVVATVEEKDFAATTFELSNGIKVTIKPTDFKSDEILMNAVKYGGTNNYDVKDKNNARNATSIVASMGYGEFTPNDLDKVLAGKPVGVRMSIGSIQNTISGNSNVKDFETMLQLMYLKITAPREDKGLFESYINKQKSQIMFMSANPQTAFFDTTLRSLYNNHPLAPGGIPRMQDYEDIDMNRAIEIYKNEFATADGYHFFFIGNIDPKVAQPLIETYIGSLPKSGKTPAYKDNGVRPVGGKKLVFKKGQENQSMIFAVYSGDITYSTDFAISADAVAEVLNIKVIEELREKLGGIYTGGYGANVSKRPYGNFRVFMQLPCGPENVEKLLTAADAEIKKIQQSGPEQKDLDKVKSQWKEAHRTELKENKYWLGAMSDVLFWKDDKSIVFDFEKTIDKLTPADVQKAAQTLFKDNNGFISILYPENFEDKH